jgi:hypothetical protein
MSSQIEIAITKSMETAFVSTMRDTAKQLSEKFGFSYEEALKALEIDSSKPSTMVTLVKPSKKVKELDEPVTSRELKFPLPFSGRIVDDCCLAVLNNCGLYSQCLNPPSSKSDQPLCSKCFKQTLSSPDGRPPYGFISERIEKGDDFIDPKKGNRPVPFTKVMKKLKLTREMVENEVSRLDIPFDTNHFDEPESKRGRPKKNEDELVPVKSKKASKNLTIELPHDHEMSSLSGSEDDFKAAATAKKQQKRAEKEAADQQKRAADQQKRAEKEAADQQKRAEKAEKEAVRKAKEVVRKDSENAKKEIRMMAKEDSESREIEKATKKAAAAEEKKKETIPEPELIEEEEHTPPINFAVSPKKQTDVVIDGIVYVFQNGFIFHKNEGNKYAGKYNWNTKEVEWDLDDDEEIDEEEESIVASESDGDNDDA